MAVFKKILISLSVAFNAIFLFFLVLAFPGKTGLIAFPSLDSSSCKYLSSAFIVSLPEEEAGLLFGPAEFSLKKGALAAIQLSFYRGAQLNLAMEPLYDHSVVSVEASPSGLLVKGVSPGEAVLQIFRSGGFKDIARIIVYE
jgi:hypothetical protein